LKLSLAVWLGPVQGRIAGVRSGVKIPRQIGCLEWLNC
jgi:hypothetical protein